MVAVGVVVEDLEAESPVPVAVAQLAGADDDRLPLRVGVVLQQGAQRERVEREREPVTERRISETGGSGPTLPRSPMRKLMCKSHRKKVP